jgi:MFS family permease
MSRDLLLVAIALFSWGVGEGMFLIFQSVYLDTLGATSVVIGLVFGAQGISMAVTQTPAGYLADRLGSRPLMWASWILGTAAAWMMALAGTLPAFVTGLLIYGLTSAVLAPMNSYITAVRGKLTAERALTITSAFFHFGAVLGPLLGGFIGSRLGLATVYQIAAAIFILSTALVLFVRRPPAPEYHHPPGERTVLKNRAFLSLTGLVFLTMFALYFAQPLTPIYLQNQHGLSLQQIGLLGTFSSLGIVTISLALGHLKPHVGYLAAQPFVAIFALLILRGWSPYAFYIGYLFLGGYRLARTMSLAQARSLIHPQETGLAYGLLETANAAAMIAAPPLAGLLFDRSPDLIYTLALVMIAVMFFVNLVTHFRREAQAQPPALTVRYE